MLSKLTLLHHFLDGAGRVYLHCKEVVESVDLGCVFGELLTKGIRQVVCGIGGLNYEPRVIGMLQ
jgi:hypothetical protein